MLLLIGVGLFVGAEPGGRLSLGDDNADRIAALEQGTAPLVGAALSKRF